MAYDARKDPQPPGVFINPGTGPVEGTSHENAEANVRQFVADLGLPGVRIETSSTDDGDGRYPFELRLGDRVCEIDMPGLPVEEVRYLGESASQNIWDFPRLYVDGSSWVWCYGLSVAHEHLGGEAPR